MALPITSISIEGYRSVRRILLPVGHLTVLAGRNGVGKTNLYRALELIQAAARGTITHEIAGEGGFESVLWAGPESHRKGQRVRLRLAVELGDLVYEVEIGLPTPTQAAIHKTEPMVKHEELSHRAGRRTVLMERDGPSVWLRDEDGKRQVYDNALLPSETVLAGFRDAAQYYELELVRRTLVDWRFYHAFRTDRESPVRRPPPAITTPTLSSDGHDLAAALATVAEVREDTVDIDNALHDAFDADWKTCVENSVVELKLTLHDMPRELRVHELSDGTLSYLCLVAALCGYRLPGFIALNEPEASLHADLIEPLAKLIARAAERTQIWVVTHSTALANALAEHASVAPRTVVKREGATWIEGLKLGGEFDDEEE
jgi:predicted ATPase